MEIQPFTQNTYLARHLHALQFHAYCECEQCLAHNRGVAEERKARTEKIRLERIERNRELRERHKTASNKILKALEKIDAKEKRQLLRALAEEIG